MLGEDREVRATRRGWIGGLRRFVRGNAFIRRKDGAVAVQFAMLALPLTMLAFGLFDVNRASVAKQQLQDALDAATLMAARSTATTDTALAAIGGPSLTANLVSMKDGTLTGSSFHLNGVYIDSSATVQVTPVVANLWLAGNMNITATSQVVRTMNKVEVALVLDNTGSMSSALGGGGSKISALQTAATSLVDVLAAAAASSSVPNAVKFSVVPFSETVNIGSTYQGQTWLSGAQPAAYGTDNFSTAGNNRFTLLSNLGLTWGGCVESRPAPYDIQDTAPSVGTPATLFVPYFAPDEPDASKISKGGGKFYSWTNNWITNDQTASTVAATRQNNITKYANNATNKANVVAAAKNGGTTMGPNRDCSISSLMRLTTDSASVKTKLQSMTANGNTNVAMGLMWGWHTLTPNGPFSDGVAYGTQHVDKIVVLLTDGDNTNDDSVSDSTIVPAPPSNNSIYLGVGYIGQGRLLDATNTPLTAASTATQRRDAIDSREAKICTAMKAKGIIIYAIGVGVSAHSQGILQACASGADHYYDVTASSQLNSVFNAIAGSIENLRISQ